MRFRLLAVLAVGALAFSCRKPETGVRIDPALATIVPADTIALAGVKIEGIRETALYKKYLEKSETLRIDELSKATGFDPRTDLYELLLVSNGKDALVMARGKFTPLGLEPKPTEGIQRMSYGGLNLLGDEKTAVAFINPSVAVAGPTPVLKHFIDHRTETNGIPAALHDQMSAVRPSSQVWAVALGGERLLALIPKSGNMANLNRMLGDVQWATLSLDMHTGVDLLAQAQYSNEKSAKQTGDALRALLGFARLNTPNNEPDLLKAYDGIQVNQLGMVLKFTAQLSPEMIDKLSAVVSRQTRP